MSRLGINTGSSANDGTGDSLRSAMGKINSNFQELYDTFGDGDDLESYVDSAGISTVAENLTGNPIINTSGAVVAGVATAEHLEVRNITSVKRAAGRGRVSSQPSERAGGGPAGVATGTRAAVRLDRGHAVDASGD